MLSELLHLIGIVLATVTACNGHEVVASWASRWVALDPPKLKFVVFLVILLLGVLIARVSVRLLSHLIQWERLHWAIQGLGMIVAAVRGVWISGVVLLVLTATGLPVLVESIHEGSLLGPYVVHVARDYISDVADLAPGANRTELVPEAHFKIPTGLKAPSPSTKP